MINPSFKVRDELESIKSVYPPLVLTEVKSLTFARYFAKYPETISGICGAEASLKLSIDWRRICLIVQAPNKCESAWQCAR
jgi:hypothetical protein